MTWKHSCPSLHVLLLACLAISVWAQDPKRPDFSDTWELNLSRSKLEIPPPSSSTFYIIHKGPTFYLKRTHVYRGKPNIWSIELITGGPQVVQKDGFYARLSWLKNVFILDSYWIEDGAKTSNIVRYSLSKNGLVFTADELVVGPTAKHHNVWALTDASLTFARKSG